MKKPLFLLIILAALITLAWYANVSNNHKFAGASGGAKMREFLLPNLPVNDVRTIRVREANKTVSIIRRDGKWEVAERDGFSASFDKIQRALASMGELKITGKLPLHLKALGDIRVIPPQAPPFDHNGLHVEFLNEKGGTLADFVIGLNVSSSGGATANESFMGGGPGEQRFVRLLSDDNAAKDEYTVWLVGEGLFEFSPEPVEWIDKSFVDVRKLQSATITALNAADSWVGQRADENSEMKFAESKDGAELDTAKATGLSTLLANPTFTDVLTKDKITPDLMKGAVNVKINTFEGFHYDVEAVEKKDLKAKPDAPGKVLLTYKVSADIAKTRKPEINEKPEDKKKKDDDFATNVKQLEEKLAKEKAAEGRIFELGSDSVAVIFKKRSEVLRDKNAKSDAQPPAGGAPMLNLPGLPRNVPAPAAAPTPPPTPAPQPQTAPPAAAPAPAKTPVTVTTPPVSAADAKPLPAAPPGTPEIKAPVPVSPPKEEAKPAAPKP